MAQDQYCKTSNIETPNRQVSLEQIEMQIIELKEDLVRYLGIDAVTLSMIANDTKALAYIIRNLGLQGKAYIKNYKGKPYLILKGRAGLRPVFRGTRYLANNPKVVKLIVGAKQLAKGAVRATGISIIAYAALDAVEFFLRDDDPRLVELFGKIAADVTKFATSAAAGFIAGAIIGSMTALVIGPLIASIFVGVLVSAAWAYWDPDGRLEKMFIEAMEVVVDYFHTHQVSKRLEEWKEVIDRYADKAWQTTIQTVEHRKIQ